MVKKDEWINIEFYFVTNGKGKLVKYAYYYLVKILMRR